MRCVDCENANAYHDEMKFLIDKISKGLKKIVVGDFCEGFKDIEEALTSMQVIHNSHLEREVNG